jgi:hypothetical protein
MGRVTLSEIAPNPALKRDAPSARPLALRYASQVAAWI